VSKDSLKVRSITWNRFASVRDFSRTVVETTTPKGKVLSSREFSDKITAIKWAREQLDHFKKLKKARVLRIIHHETLNICA
jgi:hypothetical protein